MSARRAPPLLPWMLAAVALAVAAVVPLAAAQRGRVTVVRDVAYAPADPAGSRGHLLDLWLPPGGHAGAARRPLLVWSGGSGWLSDAGKDSAEPIARYFTARGYAVAGVSVRSSEQAVFPAQVHDVKAAVRWLRAHAPDHGLDPERVAVMGDSSGGWLAAMAALTGDRPELAGEVGVTGPSSAVQAAVDLYGPTEFLSMDEQMLPGACEEFNAAYGLSDCHADPRSPESRLLGAPIRERPDLVAQASPVTYASSTAPPMLIMHGQRDVLVPEAQSRALHEALRRASAPVTFVSVPDAGHAWRQVLAGGRMADVAAFLDTALSRGSDDNSNPRP